MIYIINTLKLPRIKDSFELGIILFTIKTFFDVSDIFSVGTIGDSLLVIIAMISMIISIIKQRFSIKTLLIYLVVTIMSLYTTMKTGQSVIIITTITCLALRKKDLNKTIQTIYSISKILLTIQLFCFFALVLVKQQPLLLSMSDGRIRMSLGFVHPNSFAIYFLNLLLMWVWLNYEKINKKDILFMILLSTLCFLMTDTKTSYIITLIFSILLYLIKYSKLPKNIINIISKYIFPILSVLILILIIKFLDGNIIAHKINHMLTGRIKLGAYAYNKFGLSLLGQNIEFGTIIWESSWLLNSFTFDSIYSTFWINWGWIWIVVLSILFLKLSNLKNKKINLFIIVWSLYAITEVHGLNGFLCFPILLLTLLFDDKYKEIVDIKIKDGDYK